MKVEKKIEGEWWAGCGAMFVGGATTPLQCELEASIPLLSPPRKRQQHLKADYSVFVEKNWSSFELGTTRPACPNLTSRIKRRRRPEMEEWFGRTASAYLGRCRSRYCGCELVGTVATATRQMDPMPTEELSHLIMHSPIMVWIVRLLRTSSCGLFDYRWRLMLLSLL